MAGTDEIKSARDGDWRSIVVQRQEAWWLGYWIPVAAWVCPHGTVWISKRPPDDCDCPGKEPTDAR